MTLTELERAFLRGLLESVECLPDGAYQSACEELIEVCGEFDGRDPLDVWLEYVAPEALPERVERDG